MSRVVAVAADAATAEVMVDGARTTIAIDLVDDVAVGDMLLVHMGFAISRLSQRELS